MDYVIAGLTIIIGLALITLYFLPSLIAKIKHRRQGLAIVLLNLFLGWTLIGWVAALVWAVMVDQPSPHRFR